MKAGQIIAAVGTLPMAIGAGIAMIAGPAWLAIVLIVAACCGLAEAFAGRRG
ncbi:hypothetical protein SJX93_10070 [Streptomyces cyaneofuscatus]|uniref:hypothetical protein n=1 Tax=Streptomyces cyaneofuscatus TaxID=66883 RepID=UPI002D784740|nr:hypothetical protein [Streptomyces cyaneofuscatus]WRO09942.1 hypothetical protein SJX93_10070 [Streptomyces cyaneofuscatus]